MNAVQAVVDAGGAEALKVMERVERRMSELAGGHGPLLERFAGDTIAAGGKRLRPLLLCLSAGVPVPESEGLVRAAVAVELVHAATLVHDDVLDGSALRRGRPTVVASGGRLAATATGDLLFSRAFAELAAGREGEGEGEGDGEGEGEGDGEGEGERPVEAVRTLAGACSQLAEGELMQRSDAWNATVAVERYLERCRLKTAVLFRAACQLGALEGAATLTTSAPNRGSAIEALATFGEQIGVAFQILDDILDVAGPPERTGKPRGADLLDGTVTLPLILARPADPILSAIELRSITTPERAAEVCDRIAATGALDSAKGRALELVASAKALLPDLPERQRGALDLVADGVVDRYA